MISDVNEYLTKVLEQAEGESFPEARKRIIVAVGAFVRASRDLKLALDDFKRLTEAN